MWSFLNAGVIRVFDAWQTLFSGASIAVFIRARVNRRRGGASFLRRRVTPVCLDMGLRRLAAPDLEGASIAGLTVETSVDAMV